MRVEGNLNYRRRVSKCVTNRTTARAKARKAEILINSHAIFAYSRATNATCCMGVASSVLYGFVDLALSACMRIRSLDVSAACLARDALLVPLGTPEPANEFTLGTNENVFSYYQQLTRKIH